MNVERIMLEITRNCTLACEHCCRGDKEVVNMSLTTIDNIFKDVKHVGEIFLTGGEPLIAINQLEYLAFLIESGKIIVDKLSFITNATVLGSRLLQILKRLQAKTLLHIRLSSDIFHIIELEKRDLLQKRKENIDILREFFGLTLHTTTKTSKNESKTRGLIASGRAKNITKERLDEINKMIPFNYIISSYVPIYRAPEFINGEIIGNVYIDVAGNLVSLSCCEFKLEDIDAARTNINVNNLSLGESVSKFYESCRNNDEYVRHLG